jgi:bifunctional DNA-binding transcriptional regulator/antitoxin component of YhaV-PrlF toxin-antitoxin module
MNAVWKDVSESGQLELPEEVRSVLGVEHGGKVMIELIDNEIRLRSVADIVARSQALAKEMLKDHPDFSVDAFLAERKSMWRE